jgi:hypothetical protein
LLLSRQSTAGHAYKSPPVAPAPRLRELRQTRERQYQLYAQARVAGDADLADRLRDDLWSAIATDAWAQRVLAIDDAHAAYITIAPELSEDVQEELADLLALDPAIPYRW